MGSSGRGRRVVIAYSLVAAATQILWLTFAPIDTSAAHHYGVSTDAIGWLAEIFPLLYVVLALPAGRLLDAGFRPALASGAGLVASAACCGSAARPSPGRWPGRSRWRSPSR